MLNLQAPAPGAFCWLIVQPFEIPGTARIALVQDSVGAVLGLWQAHAKQGHG